MVTTGASVRARRLAAPDREAWDALVARERSFALLQSWAWGSFKERTGWEPVRLGIERDGNLVAGAQVLLRRRGPASFAYVPRGPVGAWLDDDVRPALFAGLRTIMRSNRSLLLRIEAGSLDDPSVDGLLRAEGLRPARTTNQPRGTIVVDLADGSNAALARMHQKARYNIRRAERQGVTVREGTAEDLPAFHRMMSITGERAGFPVRDLAYYRTQWETFAPEGSLRLFIASHGDTDLAMNVSATFGAIGAYLHGASANVRRDLNPNEALMWEAMRWSESRGCTSFDLWGIPEEAAEAALAGDVVKEPDHPTGLWGVYGFKRRLGQRVELYTRAHDLARPRALAALTTRLGARD